ncbi:MAG: SufD family Fe-S cluster assembly protein [Steroidobacteraceae bacterium]
MATGGNNLIDRLQAEHAAVAERLPSAAHAGARRAALAQLVADGLPDNREENWRYANLRALGRASFVSPDVANAVTTQELPPPLPGFDRYVFVEGRLAAGLSADTTGDVSSGIAGRPMRSTDAAAAREARFALVSDAFAVDGLSLGLPGRNDAIKSAARRQIEVLFVATADASAGSSYPRLAIDLAAGGELQLVERHISVGTAAALVNGRIDIELARDATLDHVRLQQLGARCTLIETLAARLATNAQYRLHCIANGAAASRSTLHVSLEGQGARHELTAGCVASGNQTLDTYAVVDHAAPGAMTRELFRGIATGRGRVAFNGKMIVRKNAHGADSQQMLKGLLAGPEAEIDLRPQLEIYTDDVRASHGATTGKLDDAMLFYLLSRGIEREMAHSLLKWAFIEEVLVGIKPESLRRSLEAELAGQFKDIAALDGLLGGAK